MFGWRLMRIHGESMSPTLTHGDLVAVDRRAYRRRAPARGDLAVCQPEALHGRAVVKRIAALPQESVAVERQTWQLGPEEYFVLGDRPAASTDSRGFGPVPQTALIGVVRGRLWPWKARGRRTVTGGS